MSVSVNGRRAKKELGGGERKFWFMNKVGSLGFKEVFSAELHSQRGKKRIDCTFSSTRTISRSDEGGARGCFRVGLFC